MQRSEQNPDSGLAAARLLFAYLSETDPRPAVHSGRKHPCDAIMGFGVFDRRLPREEAAEIHVVLNWAEELRRALGR